MKTHQTNERTSSSFDLAEGTAREAAIKALEKRGVVRAEELLNVSTPTVILAWCRWWDSQSNKPGKELLVSQIRSGKAAPSEKRSSIEQERDYGFDVRRWVAHHFPELCTPNPELIELERQAYGDALADNHAAFRDPHHAAVAAVFRLHGTHGRSLTVREHGEEIRQAVEVSDREAIEDMRRIVAKKQAPEAA